MHSRWLIALGLIGCQPTQAAQSASAPPASVTTTTLCSTLKAQPCLPFARGAWTLEAAAPNEWGPRWTPVAYVDGKRIASNKTLDDQAMLGKPDVTSLASDYDGNGIVEMYVHTSAPDPETGGHVEAGALFTVAGGAVDRLKGTSGLRDIGTPVDVDGDGLLDLPTSAGIRLSGDVTCKTAVADWKPARFLAHAQRGGVFSLDDAVAKKLVLTWCPAAPSAINNATDAVCAHLWATRETLPTLRAKVGCTPWDCKAEAQSTSQLPSAARDCAYRLQALEDAIPFSLP